jgi:hypothetical protein
MFHLCLLSFFDKDSLRHLIRIRKTGFNVKIKRSQVLEASNMSGIVARNLSGLIWSPMEVPDETDGDVTGDPEDAI